MRFTLRRKAAISFILPDKQTPSYSHRPAACYVIFQKKTNPPRCFHNRKLRSPSASAQRIFRHYALWKGMDARLVGRDAPLFGYARRESVYASRNHPCHSGPQHGRLAEVLPIIYLVLDKIVYTGAQCPRGLLWSPF